MCENRPVSPRHYTTGNYRGRHNWKDSGSVAGFGIPSKVYIPDIGQDADPRETGRYSFSTTTCVVGGATSEPGAKTHYGTKVTMTVPDDQVAPTTSMAQTKSAASRTSQSLRSSRSQLTTAQSEDGDDAFNPWVTSTGSQFQSPSPVQDIKHKRVPYTKARLNTIVQPNGITHNHVTF